MSFEHRDEHELKVTVAVVVWPAGPLLAPSDLHAVLGGTEGDGDLTSAPDGFETICSWVISTTPTRGFSVQLAVHTNVSAADFKQQRRIVTDETRIVRHLGDAAFSERVVVAGRVFDDLWVRKAPVARSPGTPHAEKLDLAALALRSSANCGDGSIAPDATWSVSGSQKPRGCARTAALCG